MYLFSSQILPCHHVPELLMDAIPVQSVERPMMQEALLPKRDVSIAHHCGTLLKGIAAS